MKIRVQVKILGYLQSLFTWSGDPQQDEPLDFIETSFRFGGYYIRPIKENELAMYKETTPVKYCFESIRDVEQARYVVDGAIDVAPLVRQVTYPLLIAFRIFKQGYVNIFPIHIEILQDGAPRPFAFSWQESSLARPHSWYFLREKEFKSFETFITETTQVLGNRSVESYPEFLSFVKGGYDRQLDLKSAVTDYIVALDSLFGIRKGNGCKLPLMTSTLLEDDFAKKKDVYEFLRKAYSERSKLSHYGRLKEWSEKDLKPNVMRLEEIVRRTLRIYLEYLLKGKDKSDLRSDVKRMIRTDDRNKILTHDCSGSPAAGKPRDKGNRLK